VFPKVALLFLQVRVVFIISSFEFQQVKLHWLHRRRWVPPMHSISIHRIITFGGNAGILLQAEAKAKNSSWV